MSTITLPNIRVSSDLEIRLKLKDGGVAIDWSTLTNIKASIYSDRQRSLAGRCDIAIDEEDSTILVCRYSANKPQYPGVNRVIVSCTYDGETKTYDKPAFTFVRWTDDQAGQSITIDDPDIDVEITVEDISSSILQEAVEAANSAAERANDAAAAAEHMVDIHTGPAGADGADGKSAYELAVEEGYTGTEEEWLASLHGADGTDGTDGTDGKSAYEIAVDEGFVGTEEQWLASLKGEQGNTGSSVDYPFELVNNRTTDDATKGLSAAEGKRLGDDLSQLEAEVGDLAEELHEVNPHITGRMGIGDTNEDIDTETLPEYTDQYGIATIAFNTPGYLWVCLENESFRVTSGGIEIPMVYVKEDGDLHCFVSAEMINAGTLQFKVESIHPIRSDTERLVLTARSYTITYGDEIPEFGYTANGEVEGDPVITCEATSESGVGTYTIHIARGTVTDANAVYVDGVLTIQKAELVVTAEDKFVGIGGQMPAFTVQYSGFVNGDTSADLTTVPTCTTDAVDTSTPGTYTIVPSGGVADNYSFTYVDGELRVGVIREITQAQIEQSGSCGAYIGTSGQYLNKWTTSTTYYGIILDVRQYQGMTLRFARREGANWMRFALLTSPTITNHASPSYISDEGYTTQVQHDYAEGDTYFDLVIPASASYLYIYTFSNSGGTYTGPGGIMVMGTMLTSEMKDMEASLFSTQTSIGDNGTVYTGSSASTVVCTGYLSANEYGYLGVMKFLHNNAYPEGVTRFRTNIAYYDPNKKFIKRDSYKNISDDISTAYEYILPPSCGFVRVMVTQLNGDTQLSGDTIRFDNDDIQSKGTTTS